MGARVPFPHCTGPRRVVLTYISQTPHGDGEALGARQQVVLEAGQPLGLGHLHAYLVLLLREPRALAVNQELEGTRWPSHTSPRPLTRPMVTQTALRSHTQPRGHTHSSEVTHKPRGHTRSRGPAHHPPSNAAHGPTGASGSGPSRDGLAAVPALPAGRTSSPSSTVFRVCELQREGLHLRRLRKQRGERASECDRGTTSVTRAP